jgi:capping protein beta
MKGTWDSIHVVEVVDKGKNAHYKLTSTVMLFIETETKETGRVTLAGSLTRQARHLPLTPLLHVLHALARAVLT